MELNDKRKRYNIIEDGDKVTITCFGVIVCDADVELDEQTNKWFIAEESQDVEEFQNVEDAVKYFDSIDLPTQSPDSDPDGCPLDSNGLPLGECKRLVKFQYEFNKSEYSGDTMNEYSISTDMEEALLMNWEELHKHLVCLN